MSQVGEEPRPRDLRFDAASDAGLTLIELLVVLLVIGILLTIIVPTYMSPPAKTVNRPAHANLLYRDSSQSELRICSQTGVSSVTAVDVGLQLSSPGRATRPKAVPNGSSAATGWLAVSVVSPGTKHCWVQPTSRLAQRRPVQLSPAGSEFGAAAG